MSRHLVHEIVVTQLIDIAGPDDVSVSDVDRMVYSTDFFWVPQMWIDRGQRPPMPDVIVHPESTAEVVKILQIAATHRLPVIPWGGGTGSQGGGLPLYGGILLDLKKMDRIIRVDETSLTVTAEAGINGQRLEEALNARGFTLAHYPASQAGATLGGYLAARGSGTLSTKYGKAEDMVVSMEVVLASGEVMQTLPVPNHACGPGLVQLFVGSEGTLGVITAATMRIEPMPEVRRFNAYLFPGLHAGIEAGRKVMTRRLRPCVIRLYNERSTARVVRDVLHLDLTGSYMVVGVDGLKRQVDVEEELIRELCLAEGARELGPELGEHWWKHRYDFYFPPYARMLPKMYGTIESTTTFDRIVRLHDEKKRVIEEGYADWHAQYFAHLSHWFPWGAMVYDQFQIERPPQDPTEALRLHNAVWADAARTSLRCGGTLNDHHGIGLKLGWLMREQYGPGWNVMTRIKEALDPLNIMNPGKLGFAAPR
jgi:alkyldihydroxyacetonephosphate synthase